MIYKKVISEIAPKSKIVGCLIIHQDRFLLLKRKSNKSYPNMWGLPGGKVEEEESFEAAVIREVREETSINIEAPIFVNQYHVVSTEENFIYILFVINLYKIPEVVVEPEEHSDYEWVILEKALSLPLVAHCDDVLKDFFYNKNQIKQLSLFTDTNEYQLIITKFEENVFTLFPKESEWVTINNKKWIGLIGPPGSGKTTFVNQLNDEKIDGLNIVEESSILEPGSRYEKMLLEIFEKSDYSLFLPFQMEILAYRVWQIIKAENYSVIDDSFYNVLMYSRALNSLNMLNNSEFEAFLSNFLTLRNLVPKPSLIIRLDCHHDKLVDRVKNNRKRYHERFYSNAYIRELRLAAINIGNELARELPVIIYRSDNDEFSRWLKDNNEKIRYFLEST